MKFPRTRRDRLKDEIKRNKAEQQRQQDHVDGSKREIPVSPGSSHAPPSERSAYPSGYVPDDRRAVFDRESVQPLGANVESWSNLVDSRATSHQTPLNQANSSRTYGEEDLYDDEVFFNEDDMRKMRLGFTDPNSSYYMYPGAYATIAMMGAVPEESHFGQGLEYFGPGYQVGASSLEIFFCMWNIMTYLLDVGSDIYLAYLYYIKSHYVWFGLTLAFVLIPAVAMSVFSLMLYLRDYKYASDKKSGCRWASRIIFIILQLAPFFRMVETLIYGCKSRDPDMEVLKRRRFYDKMVNEDTDAVLLHLLQSFMEAAPQLVLQLYIITQIGTDKGTFLVVMQVFGLITSLISLASCLVSYQKSLRLSMPDKEKLRFSGMALMFLWRVFTLMARVLALAMFASYFKYWTFVAVGIHWLAMLIWVIKQDTQYCISENMEGQVTHNKCHEVCFRILCAFVQIFCFFNLIEGHTRLRCILFYGIIYFENTFFILAWYIGASMKTSTAWYHLPSLMMVLLGFWAGIFFQVIYYKYYHPNNTSVLNSQKRILWYVPFSHLSLTREIHYHPKPTGSVCNRSQLSLNQTLQSHHSMPPEHIESYNVSMPVMSAISINDEPVRKTSPVPTFHPDRSSTLTSRSSLMSRQSSYSQVPGQPWARVVQKKWQPPERMPAGFEKLNMSRDSSSTTGMGSTQRRPARQARMKDQSTPTTDVTNQEPLPIHEHDLALSGQKTAVHPPLSRLLPAQKTPPVLKLANKPQDIAESGESSDESDATSSDESSSDMKETVPLTKVGHHPLPILEEDELPSDDGLQQEDSTEKVPVMKVTAI